jgi:hypothetical protein
MHFKNRLATARKEPLQFDIDIEDIEANRLEEKR